MLLTQKENSPQRFGLLATALLAGAAVYCSVKGWSPLSSVLLFGAALAVGLATWLRPGLLKPAATTWFYLGELLGKFTSPIVLGLIFFVLLTPIGLAARGFKRDPLRLKKHPDISSHWVPRDTPHIDEQSFKNQF